MNDQHVALVVEDEPEMAAEIIEILTSLGHRAVHTESLEEGSELAERGGFCYVLLDLQIKPTRDSIRPRVEAGETLMGRIRKQFPRRNASDKHDLQILLMSGHVKEHEAVVRMLQTGGDDFIKKPLGENKTPLDTKIRTALRQSGREAHCHCAARNREATSGGPSPPPLPREELVSLSLAGRPMKKRTAVQVGDKSVALPTPGFVLTLHLMVGRLRGDGVLPAALGSRTQPQRSLQALCEQLAPYLPKGLRIAEVAPDGRFHLHPAIELGPLDPRCIEGHADARVRRLAAELLRLRDGQAVRPAALGAPSAMSASSRKLVISARWQRSKCLVVVDGQDIAMPAKPYVIMAKLGLGRHQGEEGWVDRDRLDANADASWSAMTRVYDHLRDAGLIPADVIENNLAKSYRLTYLAEQIEIDRAALLRHPHEPVRAELARFVAGP